MKFRDWFRCPICGDAGETKLFMVGGTEGGVKFECSSTEHQVQHRFFNKFKREEWRRTHRSQSLISKLFPNPDVNKMNADLVSCVTCPYCGSSETDGAIEHRRLGDYRKRATLVSTVWCLSCGEYDRNWIQHVHEGYPDLDKETILSGLEYPPNYIEQ